MTSRERRIKFETYLINERKKMETFRLRETKEFLSIDELKEKCDTMDVFIDILKVTQQYLHDDVECQRHKWAANVHTASHISICINSCGAYALIIYIHELIIFAYICVYCLFRNIITV